MKRYISAATKTYNKDELLTSIYYLFDEAAEAAGASQDDIEITSIDVRKETRPVRYSVCVDFKYQNKDSWLHLYDVPINSTIPEDYWITTESYSKQSYFDNLVHLLDTSKFGTVKQAFDEFCNVVDSASKNYRLTFECSSYPPIDKLELHSDFIYFDAYLTDVEFRDPDIHVEISRDSYTRDPQVILKDITSGASVVSDSNGFSLRFSIDDSESFESIHSKVLECVASCRSYLDAVANSLQTSEEYRNRLSEIASLLESVPGITVEYSDKLEVSPRCNFKISGPFGTSTIWVDNVFEADDKKLLRNLKARIRRYNSKPSDNTFRSSYETLFSKE